MGRSKLQQIYYDPKRVGSYGGVDALRRVVLEHDVDRWLSKQDAYSHHKRVRRHFKRRCVVVGGPNQKWQADLVDSIDFLNRPLHKLLKEHGVHHFVTHNDETKASIV